MAPTSSARVRKTDQQLEILRELYRAGMNTTRDTGLIAEAVQRTNLSRAVIKQWITNMKKPNRGKQKKKASVRQYNIYTAFIALPYENFHGNPLDMSSMVKERGQKYQHLRKTVEGLKFLNDNHERMNLKDRTADLTDTEKHNRALGIYSRIQKETELLNTLGYKSVALVAQPERPTTLLGPAESVFYMRNNMHIADDFVEHVGCKKSPPDQKTVLRHRVQMLFNRLYAEATNRPGARMPYQQIGDGTVKITIGGLPEGIVFKKPHSYGSDDMRKILESTLSLTSETVASSNSVSTLDGPPSDSIPTAHTDPQEGAPANLVEAQEDDEDEFVLQLENICDLEVEAIEDVPSIEMISQEITPNDSSNVITVDHPSRLESLQYAKDLAKKVASQKAPKGRGQEKRNRTKSDKGPKRSKTDATVGKRIKQVFITSGRGKQQVRKPYTGTIIDKCKNKITVHYDDKGEEDCTFTLKQVETFIKSKTFVFLD